MLFDRNDTDSIRLGVIETVSPEVSSTFTHSYTTSVELALHSIDTLVLKSTTTRLELVLTETVNDSVGRQIISFVTMLTIC